MLIKAENFCHCLKTTMILLDKTESETDNKMKKVTVLARLLTVSRIRYVEATILQVVSALMT